MLGAVDIKAALALAIKGVQNDDGYNYLVPAADLAAYSEAIRGLVGALKDAWDAGFEACNTSEGGFHEPYPGENPFSLTTIEEEAK